MSPFGLPGPASFRRIFVGGVPRGTTEPQLRAAFVSAGADVGVIEFVVDRTTGVQRGFAYVELPSPLDVMVDSLALRRLRSAELDGRILDIQGIPNCPLRQLGDGREVT